MRQLLPTLCKYLDSEKSIVLATLISSKGSSPRHQGACLLADENGLVSGTIGGGQVEAKAIEECKKLLTNKGAKLFSMPFTNTSPTIAGMVCGGNVEILLQSIPPEHACFYKEVQKVVQHEKGIFVTQIDAENLHSPCSYFYYMDTLLCTSQDVQDSYLSKITLDLKSYHEPKYLDHEGKKYFINPLLPACKMIIVGGGHVAVPTAELASIADFSVHVIDDRTEFSIKSRFPTALSVTTSPEFENCLASFSPQNDTYIIIVTKGHTCDGKVLSQALQSKAGYIGMIGSKKKRRVVYDFMIESGFSQEDLQRVHCPIGLAIGAETPTEIAFSIVSQCIAHRSKKRNDSK